MFHKSYVFLINISHCTYPPNFTQNALQYIKKKCFQLSYLEPRTQLSQFDEILCFSCPCQKSLCFVQGLLKNKSMRVFKWEKSGKNGGLEFYVSCHGHDNEIPCQC